MKLFINDVFNEFSIEPTQLNVNAVKSLFSAMASNGLCYREKQKLVFDECLFYECWMVYCACLLYFDPNYNRKSDFTFFFKYLIDAKLSNSKINFYALFCPGYTKNGYKNYLGNTTLWKLKELRNIVNMLNEKKIDTSMTCYYSDVFLENCDNSLEPNWKEQLEYNRHLFHVEGEKYFHKSSIQNASDISVFSSDIDIEGYVDEQIVASLPKTTYVAFQKGNEKFYKAMGFTEEQMKFRNDRLITMYRVLSDYLNSQHNAVFLPMENMYERENIFSENGTCTMYLKLKK